MYVNDQTYVPDLVLQLLRRRRGGLSVFVYLLPKRLKRDRVFFNFLLERLEVGFIVYIPASESHGPDHGLERYDVPGGMNWDRSP